MITLVREAQHHWEEERIRTKFLKDNHIDTIIGLPSNLFYLTGIPVCILLFKNVERKMMFCSSMRATIMKGERVD